MHTKLLKNLREERCQQDLPLDLLVFTEIWNDLHCFYAPGYLHRAPSPVRRALGVRHALANFSLRAGCQCAAPSVCVALPGVCAALLETSSHSLEFLKPRSLTLAMSLPSLQENKWLCFGPQQVYIGLGVTGLIFSSLKTHFLMFMFCTFLIDFKTP